MEAIKYTCSCCGKEQEKWPALAFDSPDNYNALSAEDKQSIGELSTDFCVIRHPDDISQYIRCTLTQKIVGHCEDLEYGLWVSLSEKSFRDYSDNFHRQDYEAIYFGWLCNDIPEYQFSDSIPTTVFTRTGNSRPEIVPHQDTDHPFVRDYYNGITKQEAEKRIKAMIRKTGERHKSVKKPWWKLR